MAQLPEILFERAPVTFAIVIAIVVIVSWILGYRRRWMIAVRPQLRLTGVEDLPPPMREFLGRAAPILLGKRFQPAASVHAPHFGTFLRWTQVLFIDRDTGDRASILCMQNQRVCVVQLAFATEFEDGQRVLTESGSAWLQDIDVREMCARHRRAIAELTPRPGRTVSPNAGEEVSWLADRAALVAAAQAKKAGFVRDFSGTWYVPPCRLALRIAWQQSRVRRIWRRKLFAPAQSEMLRAVSVPKQWEPGDL